MIRRHSVLLLLAMGLPILCRAQSADPASFASQQTPAAPADKPKKVWTNEDVKSARSVSVVGDKQNQQYTMTKQADAATVAKCRSNLQKLQAQLDGVNQQTARLLDKKKQLAAQIDELYEEARKKGIESGQLK